MSLIVLLAGCATQSGPTPANVGATPAVAVATIPVGEPPTVLAMAPDGSRLYAASSGKLFVIATDTNSIVATIPIDPYAAAIASTPNGKQVLVTSLFSVRLTVVDTAVNAVVNPIDLFTEFTRGGFGRIAITPDGSGAYVANQANQVLAIVDLRQRSVASRSVDMRPLDVAVAPDGRSVYILGCKDLCTTGTVEVMDTASQLTETSFSVGPRPYRIVLTADGSRAYTTNLGDPSVSVVDLRTNAVVATVPVPVEPIGLALAPDASQIYVTSQPTGTVTVIGAATNSVQATVQVGASARDVVATRDGRRLYVSTSHTVVAIDTAPFRR